MSKRKWKQNEIILHTDPTKYHYYVNVGATVIEPLYEYYRRRIGCCQFPMDDVQRYAFEKIIVNMCREGLIRIPDWIINSSKYNVLYVSRWWELKETKIRHFKGEPVPYFNIRDEIRLIHRILSARRRGKSYAMTAEEAEIFNRIYWIDQRIADELSESLERRDDA